MISNPTELYIQALATLNGEINYAPGSHLLYILHKQASETVKGAWLMASLSEKSMGDCKSQEDVWPGEELIALEREDQRRWHSLKRHRDGVALKSQGEI